MRPFRARKPCASTWVFGAAIAVVILGRVLYHAVWQRWTADAIEDVVSDTGGIALLWAAFQVSARAAHRHLQGQLAELTERELALDKRVKDAHAMIDAAYRIAGVSAPRSGGEASLAVVLEFPAQECDDRAGAAG